MRLFSEVTQSSTIKSRQFLVLVRQNERLFTFHKNIMSRFQILVRKRYFYCYKPPLYLYISNMIVIVELIFQISCTYNILVITLQSIISNSTSNFDWIGSKSWFCVVFKGVYIYIILVVLLNSSESYDCGDNIYNYTIYK